MSPFLQTRGGGSAQGFKSSGGGGPDGLSQANAAETVWKLITEGGQTANGYYWLKGNGSVGNARQFYCILDPNWMSLQDTPLGAEWGWAIICNHDSSKLGSQGHQARPTAQTGYAGSDGGNVGGANGHLAQIPEFSYTQHCELMPYRVMMHFCYNNGSMGSWNSSNGTGAPLAYYYCGYNSTETMPTSNAWIKAANWSASNYYLRMNGSGHARRLGESSSNWDTQAMGVCNNGSGPYPYQVGSGSAQQYPCYIGSWNWNSGNGCQSTFSFHDTSNTGWDDWQDGSGMGDSWGVESVGNNAYRNYPSAIAIH
tara:strand:+ start:157 stop:1089 length:933 start_codon:yes stop_codon:yes gene_type:complete